MSKKSIPTNLVAQATSVQESWSHIDEKLIIGGITVATLANNIKDLRQVATTLAHLERQISELRIERDELEQSTWNNVKRVRAAIKGIYGDDSRQYHLVGGTRLSDRKSPRRTPVSAS